VCPHVHLARLFYTIKLKTKPTIGDLIDVIQNSASSDNRKLAAFQYLMRNWGAYKNLYSKSSYDYIKFVPCGGPDGVTFGQINKVSIFTANPITILTHADLREHQMEKQGVQRASRRVPIVLYSTAWRYRQSELVNPCDSLQGNAAEDCRDR
jgi:hypothetical protein